jgi:hypothetical protein
MEPSYQLSLVLLAVPAVTGLLLGWVSERSFLSAFLLLGEPLLLGVGLYGVAVCALQERWLPAAALAAGLVAGGLAVRLPPVPETPPSAKADWIGRVQDCANDAKPVGAPVRVMSWVVDGAPRESQVEQLRAYHPDVVVLMGHAGTSVAEALATALSGEAKHIEGDISLVVRGVFSYCSGRSAATSMSDEDLWEAALPTAGDRIAKLVVAFPGVDGVGVFPLMVVRLDAPGSVTQWRAWPHRLDEGARIVSAVARTVGAGRMVVVGDFESPPTFRHVAGHLIGAGLNEAVGPPTWPARIGAPAAARRPHAGVGGRGHALIRRSRGRARSSRPRRPLPCRARRASSSAPARSSRCARRPRRG